VLISEADLPRILAHLAEGAPSRQPVPVPDDTDGV
jgi:hypothetical protein